MSAVRSESEASYATPASVSVQSAVDAQIIESAMKILDERLHRDGELMTEPGLAGKFIKLKLAEHEHEVFGAMFLDTRHRMIAWEDLFRGTVDGAEVHPREVVKAALKHNAAAVIVGHNHPSGNSDPSAADRAVTTRLKQALALVDIRLLDHFVVGHGPPTSLASRGWV